VEEKTLMLGGLLITGLMTLEKFPAPFFLKSFTQGIPLAT
jgi:hypothetical protein